MDVIVDLSRYKALLENKIYLDLNIEEYLIEHFTTNTIEHSKVILEIQQMILDNLGQRDITHPNIVFKFIDENEFITKIVNFYDALTIIFTNQTEINFNTIRFKEWKNKEKLQCIIKVE